MCYRIFFDICEDQERVDLRFEGYPEHVAVGFRPREIPFVCEPNDEVESDVSLGHESNFFLASVSRS